MCLTIAFNYRSLYDTIRDGILTCAQKLTLLSLIYCTEPTTKKWKTEKLRGKKTDMLRSMGKQSGESVESVLEKKGERLRWEGFAEVEGFKL